MMSLRFFAGLLRAADAGVPGRSALLLVAMVLGTTGTAAEPVDFAREILPVFQRNCLACHHEARAKGGLNLETPESAARGGTTGPGLVPGRPEESLIVRAAAHELPDLVMPPAGNKANAADLTPEELGRLRLWIAQGARGGTTAASRIAWGPIAPTWAPAYAVALSPDGRLIAGARANRIELGDVDTRTPRGALVDPTLESVAHRDVVNALAFSRDGSWLASAAFREVKLWRRRSIGREGAERHALGPRIAQWEGSPGVPTLVGTEQGALQVLDSSGLVRQTVHLGRGPVRAIVPQADGRRIAFIAGDSRGAVLDRKFGRLLEIPVPVRAETLVWHPNGKLLLTGTADDTRLKVWSVPDSWTTNGTLTEVAASPDLGDTLACAASMEVPEPRVVLVSAEGSVRRLGGKWGATAAIMTHRVAAVRGALSPDGQWLAVASSDGAVQVMNLDDGTLTALPEADRFLEESAGRASRERDFIQSEVNYHRGAATRGEAEVKRTGDTLTQATERLAEREKALAGRRTEKEAQQQLLAAAEREAAELTATLKQVTEAQSAAEARVGEARGAVEAAADTATRARAAADLATRALSDLERAAEVADPGTDRPAEEVLLTVRAAAHSRREAAGAADATLRERLDGLTAAARASGEAKAAQDRALAEVPPRQKQVEERRAAAVKALADLDGPLRKAEIAVATATDDLALARQQAARAALDLEETRAALAAVETALPGATAALDQAQAEVTRHASSPVVALAFSAEGDSIATVRASGRVRIQARSSGQQSAGWALDAGAPLGVAWEDASTLAVTTTEGIARFSLGSDWELVRTLGGEGVSAADGFHDRVNALAFAPDGQTLLAGGGEPTRGGELKLWSVADGVLRRDFGAAHSDAVLSVAFSPDGRLALSGGADRFMRLMDLGSGKVVRSFEGHTHHVMGVAWLQEGRTIASAGADGVVKVWNRRTGERLKNLDGFGKEVVGIQPVGMADQFVALAGGGHSRVFKAGGETVRTLDAGGAFLHALAVTPDGRWAAAGDARGTWRIWSLGEGRLVTEFVAQPR